MSRADCVHPQTRCPLYAEKGPNKNNASQQPEAILVELEIHSSPQNMLVECNLVAKHTVTEADSPKINVEIFKLHVTVGATGSSTPAPAVQPLRTVALVDQPPICVS